MLKDWQFNILFFVGVGGAIILLIGPELGLDINANPTAATGVGAILTYVLTQRKTFTKQDDSGGKHRKGSKTEEKDDEDGST